jgi:hypothetical protein
MLDILKITGSTRFTLLLCFLSVCFLSGTGSAEHLGRDGLYQLGATLPSDNPTASGSIDKTRYITIDEIHPGADAYCLTVLQGDKVEKFNLQVLSVMRNYRPGRDTIIVIGTDEEFKRIGPVRGCSGSPVYINGRMAGALAGGWNYSKDPLYTITPIEDMLQVGSRLDGQTTQPANQPVSLSFDFSKPLDIADISQQLTANYTNSSLKSQKPVPSGYEGSELLITSLPAEVCNDIAPWFEPLGLTPVAGGSTNSKLETQNSKPSLEPGSILTIPLISGDISMAVIGTATEVVDNKVYALGHGFLGYSPLDLPMATGHVHTVVSNTLFSFKLTSSGARIGAIRADGPTGIYGQIGAEPKMIPMQIIIDHYNESVADRKKTYDCEVAVNRIYTPLVTQTAIIGAIAAGGTLPPEHMVKYKADIGIDGFEAISFENVSSGKSFREFANEAVSVIAMLMNNPYRRVNITTLNFEVQIIPKHILSNIWSVKLSDSKARPGQTIDVLVVLQSYMSEKKTHRLKFEVPDDLPPGQYNIVVAGSYEYENFLRKVSPHKFTTHNLATLVEGLKNILTIRRDKLYLTMTLPPGGVVIQRSELSDLPQTKAMLLSDTKRTITSFPLQHWLETNIYTGDIVIGQKSLEITVEK